MKANLELRKGPQAASRQGILCLVAASLFAFSGCSRETQQQSPAPGPHRAPDAASAWTDIAAAAGITAPLFSGSLEKRYIVESKGGGVAFFDYDEDGFQDLYVVNGSSLEILEGKEPGGAHTNHFYRNNGDGTFRDVTKLAGVGDSGWGFGCVAADYDNDGDQDLYVSNLGRNVLYRNNGDGTFTDVAKQAGVEEDRFSTSAAFGDVDGDEDLDLYVANYAEFSRETFPNDGAWCQYEGVRGYCGPHGYPGTPDTFFANNGDGTFTDATEHAGLMEEKPGFGFTPIFEDFDNNGTLDLYVPNDSCPNYLYRNLGNERFEDVSTASGTSVNEYAVAQASMGVAVGDYDQDGWMDIFLTHFSNDYNTMYHNEGMLFTDESYATGVAQPSIDNVSWGTFFFDYDNDGDLDLFVANGHTYPELGNGEHKFSYRQANQLFENSGDGKFADISQRMGNDFLAPKVSRGAALADIDNDGDLDIFITELDEPPTLLRNNLDNGNHFLSITLRAGTGNRYAVGARAEVSVAGKRQLFSVRCGDSFLSHSDRRIHVGLGAGTRVEHLKITWPDKTTQEFSDIPVDRFIEITKGEDKTRTLFSR